MIRNLGHVRQWGLCVLCALAFLMLGFAHKPPVADAGQIPASEIAAYILPDGTLPVLCLPSQDGKAKHHGHETGSVCEACRLAAATILPAPLDTLGIPVLHEIAHALTSATEQSARIAPRSGVSARGPPLNS